MRSAATITIIDNSHPHGIRLRDMTASMHRRSRNGLVGAPRMEDCISPRIASAVGAGCEGCPPPRAGSGSYVDGGAGDPRGRHVAA